MVAVEELGHRMLLVGNRASARWVERRMVVVLNMGSEKERVRIGVVAGRCFVVARMRTEDTAARLGRIVVVLDTAVLAGVRKHS